MREHFTLSRVMRPLGFAAVGLGYLCGCEDVVTVDLRDSEPKIVIEGLLLAGSGESRFVISRTTDFYTPNAVELVSGATIVVSDDVGNVDTLVEHAQGVYGFFSFFRPSAGRTYYAAVTVEGQTYVASTTTPERIEIDSIRTEYQEGGGIGTEEDEGYQLHVYFQDVADRSDYVRIKLGVNGSYSEYYYLYDGRYSDGNTVDYEYFFNVFEPGDWASVELHAMDRTMYYYFLTLDEVWAREDAGNFLDATPANPNTNWSGGALGYFGAFNISRQVIEIPGSGQ
jgi:hypothetical protein